MTTLFEYGVSCIVLYCLWNKAAYAESCAKIGKPKNQTLQVCQDNILSADRVYIDSDGAPKHDNITCGCTIEMLDTNPTTDKVVTVNSYVGEYDVTGIEFRIEELKFSNIYNRSGIPMEINNTVSLVFRRTVADTKSSVCLSLTAKGFGASVKVHCHDYESVTSTDRVNVPVPGIGFTVAEPPSNDTLATSDSDESSSLQIAVVVAVSACVTTVVGVAVFGIIWWRRNKHTSLKQTNTVAQEDDEADVFTTENIHYESAEGQANSTTAPHKEQQCLLRGNVEQDHGDAYSEIGTCDKMGSSKHISVKEDGLRPGTAGASKSILAEEPGAKDDVYNSVGSTCTTARPTQTEHVYNTVVRENDYNSLNEVLGAKIVSANIYGTASGNVNN